MDDNRIGVYFLFDNEEIVYVGKSDVSCFSRVRQHQREGEKTFNGYQIQECNKSLIDELEKYYIKKYTPKYNITHNPTCYRKPVNYNALKIKASAIIKVPEERWHLIEDINVAEIKKVLREMDVDLN